MSLIINRSRHSTATITLTSCHMMSLFLRGRPCTLKLPMQCSLDDKGNNKMKSRHHVCVYTESGSLCVCGVPLIQHVCWLKHQTQSKKRLLQIYIFRLSSSIVQCRQINLARRLRRNLDQFCASMSHDACLRGRHCTHTRN